MKHHWKQLTNPDYIGAYDFQPGEERIVTIKSVERKQVTGPDGKKEECTVCFFEEPYKPMILNVTNCKMISRIAETPYIEDWTGKSFKIIVTKVKAFGEVVDALRVKSEHVTKKKPTLEHDTQNFINCKAAYEADKSKLQAIKDKYEISPQVLKELING